MHTADQLRDKGVAAAALFRPSMGGWIVQIFPGGIRRRPPPAADLGTVGRSLAMCGKHHNM